MFFCIQLWGTTLVFQVWNKNKMFRSKGQKNACFWSKEYAIRKMFRRKIIDKAVIVRYWNVSKCFLCFITPPIYWSLQLSLTLALLAACLTVHSMLNSLQKSFTCNLGLGKYVKHYCKEPEIIEQCCPIATPLYLVVSPSHVFTKLQQNLDYSNPGIISGSFFCHGLDFSSVGY